MENIHNNIIILSEEELCSLLNTEKEKKEFLKQKSSLITRIYTELFSDSEIEKQDEENIGFTYKNEQFYVTPLNIIKELISVAGIEKDYNGILENMADYNQIFQKFCKIINNRIIEISKISTFDELRDIDTKIYNLVTNNNFSQKRKNRLLIEVKQQLIDELKDIIKQAELAFLKNDIYIQNRLLTNFNKEKLDLLIHAKKISKLNNQSKEINHNDIADLTNYFFKIKDVNKNINVKIEKNNTCISYSLNDFKLEYINIIKKLLNTNSGKENLYHIINKKILQKNDYFINEDTHYESPTLINPDDDNPGKKKVSLEERQKLLAKKEILFNNSEYLYKIKGINKLEGYIGYIYPNGKIIFEKYYTSKTNLLPTYDEAIYVMDIKNFIYITNYSRKEIIAYINNKKCKNVKRITHYGNWEKEVLKEINKKTKYNKDNIEAEILKIIINYSPKKSVDLKKISTNRSFKISRKEFIPKIKKYSLN